MADYLCVDGGTTNTRIYLVRNGKILDAASYHVGARIGAEHKKLLQETVGTAIKDILQKNKLSEEQITRVLACGMITSEFGLVNLPHIPAPAGPEELHASMYQTVLKDISTIPFAFVRGVKTEGDSLALADMMRGEETELMGLFMGGGVYILPGSHSKIITVDDREKIIRFKTMLTGEMIVALSQHTILKDAVDITIPDLDGRYLQAGYEYASAYGLNEALFKVRILKNMLSKSPVETYQFYMGAVLSGELQYVLSLHPERVIIGGKKQIKEPMAALLQMLSGAEIVAIPDEQAAGATALGMVKIYEYKL